MNDDIELAKDGIEKAVHEHEIGRVPHARSAAIVIAVLAAMLAVAENGARDAQTGSLAGQIEASDTWAQYQAKSVRRTVLSQTADLLEASPNASDPKVAARAEAARHEADRLRSEPGAEGMEQLAARAHASEHERDHDTHRYHGLETASSGLQLAIVLVTVSVVTGVRALMLGGAGLGVLAAGYGLLSGLSLV